MFQPLFDEHGMYTEPANALDLEIMEALRSFFNRGYSPRDVLTLITSSATLEMSSKMIELGMARYKQRIKEQNVPIA